ncbi:hypothetical protein DRJ16_03615 [Candidatus Woesearchaeota archaeon]|nr:MAG: hypothetical protein DRJ16_03615 [Candidatus Woesearchaeota archaeon]
MRKILILGLVVISLFFLTSTTSAWWNESWQYRKEIAITNTNDEVLTDYQVLVILNETNFDFSHANENGSDIRFVGEDDATSLNYWIESWNSTAQTAKIWIKVPSIPANNSTKIYMYYGNPEAESMSNGHAVFEQFDDFSYTVARWGEEYENNPIVTAPPDYVGARYPSVIYDADEGKYKMWYTVHDAPNGSYKMTIWYAESEDGLNWTNHQKVFEGTGTPGDFDEVSVLCGTVIKDNDTYRMWYIGRPVTGCGSSENYGIGYAESSDGINWERSPNNPILLASDLNCTFISGGAVIKDDKYRMVIQTDKRGHLELYKGVSDYPDKNWTFEADPFITNPVNETYEVNEPKLLKLNNTYYLIHPYDRTGMCGFTLTYAKSTDWINWDTYVATLLDYESSIDSIRHFPGILVPNFHGGNYVLDNDAANLYIYWSYVTTSECDDAGDFKISVAFFDNFPEGLKYWEKIAGDADVTIGNGWMKINGTNQGATIKHIKNPVSQDNIAIEFKWYYPDEATDYKEATVHFRHGEENIHLARYNVAGHGKTDCWMFERGLTGDEVSCPTDPNVIYQMHFFRYNGQVKCYVDGCGAIATYNTSEIASNITLFFVDQNSFGHYISNYIVRKYTEPEPNTSVGIEEEQGQTPPSPLLNVSGYVFYANNTPCNNPTVNVTNLNNGKEWIAETNETSNYYHFVIYEGEANASEVLKFEVSSPDGKQTNTTNHTITEDEINEGYLTLNFTLSGEPEFVFRNLSVVPTEGLAPLTINATAEVENIGGSDGECNATLLIDGEIEDWKIVSVAVGEVKTVSFTHTFEEAGSYDVTIDGLPAETVTVSSTPTTITLANSLIIEKELGASYILWKWYCKDKNATNTTVDVFIDGSIVLSNVSVVSGEYLLSDVNENELHIIKIVNCSNASDYVRDEARTLPPFSFFLALLLTTFVLLVITFATTSTIRVIASIFTLLFTAFTYKYSIYYASPLSYLLLFAFFFTFALMLVEVLRMLTSTIRKKPKWEEDFWSEWREGGGGL